MSILMARSLWAAILVVAGLLWTGCQREPSPLPQGKGGGGELRILLPAEPRELDPNSMQDETALLIAPNLYNRLVMLDSDSRLHGDLAETWELGKDGLEYTFRLRRDIRWHDGRPFTAADVKWTLERQARRASFAAEAYRRIATVEAPDEGTVIIRLRQPWTPFLSTLASYGSFILPRPEAGAPSTSPVGTGPFRFTEWVPGEKIVLTANPYFYRPGPFLDRLVYRFQPDSAAGLRMVLAGEADLLTERPPLEELSKVRRDPRLRIVTLPGDGRYMLAFNLRRQPFDDLRIRQAVSSGLDRPALLGRVLYGYGAPAFGFYTPAVPWAYNPDARAPELDPARARTLLEAAGLFPDSQGVRLKTTLLCPAITPFPEIAAAVANQLAALGILVRIEAVPGGTWMERVLRQHDYDLTLVGGSQGPDPESLNVRFGSHSPSQFMGYSNPAFDAAVAEGSRLTDLTQRARAYFRAQEILAQDLPVAPLVEGIQVTVCRRGVTGLPRLEARNLVPEYEFSLVRVNGARAESGR